VPSKRPYHHGNLRPALIAAAVERIAEVGPAAFTLREVARRAGISHNAPYRHFRDKDDLLAAVATQGFERLAKALDDSEKHRTPRKGPGTPLERLCASGLAYVRFALRSPEHLQVMFDWPLETGRHPELEAAGARAFGVLLRLVEQAQGHGDLPEGDPLPLACTAWSLVHGIAKLAISSRLPYRSERKALDFAREAIDTLNRGMRRRAGRDQADKAAAGSREK